MRAPGSDRCCPCATKLQPVNLTADSRLDLVTHGMRRRLALQLSGGVSRAAQAQTHRAQSAALGESRPGPGSAQLPARGCPVGAQQPERGAPAGGASSADAGQHLDSLLLRAVSIDEEAERLSLGRARDQRGPWACEGAGRRAKLVKPGAEHTLRDGDVPAGVPPALAHGLARLPPLSALLLEQGIPAVALERKVAMAGTDLAKTRRALHAGAAPAARRAGEHEGGARVRVPTLDVHSASLSAGDVCVSVANRPGTQPASRRCVASADGFVADPRGDASPRGRQASQPVPEPKRPHTSAVARRRGRGWSTCDAVALPRVSTERGSSEFFAHTFGPIPDEPAHWGIRQDNPAGSALHHREAVPRQRCATAFLPSARDGVVCPTPPHRRCRVCASLAHEPVASETQARVRA